MWAGPRVINHLGAFPPCSLSLDSFFLHRTWAMAESSYAWVSVAVKRGPTTIHPRKIVKMGWENKFAELLVAVDPGLTLLLARFAFHPMINSWTPVHEVDITAPLSVSSVFKCHFVCI